MLVVASPGARPAAVWGSCSSSRNPTDGVLATLVWTSPGLLTDTVTHDERAELDQVLADLEAEEADQEADRGYASPPLSRAIARMR